MKHKLDTNWEHREPPLVRITETDQKLSPTRFPGRIPALDGLRGIAILLVLLWHAVFGIHTNSRFLSGLLAVGNLSWSGVDLFFVLSGFLIGGILLDEKSSTRYFKTFYLRRAFRILPLYGLITAWYLFRHLPLHLLAGIWGGQSVSELPVASYPTFTQNFWMAKLGLWGSISMIATWSLAVEEQFYLTIPLVVKKLNRSRLTLVLICVVIGAPLLRTLLLLTLEHGNLADYVLMPCRADALCLGVLSAVLVRNPQAWRFVLAKRVWLYSVTIGLLIIIGWLTHQQYGQTANAMVTFGYSVLGLFYTCCLLIALTKTGMSQLVLCNRRLMELGGIAYCVYLVHIPLIEAGRRLVPTYFPYFRRLPIPHALGIEVFLGGLLGIIVSLAIAKLSWRFFEQPMLQRGHAYKF